MKRREKVEADQEVVGETNDEVEVSAEDVIKDGMAVVAEEESILEKEDMMEEEVEAVVTVGEDVKGETETG